MTIRELKDRVPYVKGIVKLPSPKGLREADIPIIADTDDSLETCLGEECRAVVYMNGLVLYTRGSMRPYSVFTNAGKLMEKALPDHSRKYLISSC